MTIYSVETHAGIWHANFPSVAHLHWKKAKRWEAFWNLLKIELRGMNSYHWAQGIIDFLHNGSQVLHLAPRVGGGRKCTPRCSYYFKYLRSQPFPEEGLVSPEDAGAELRPDVGVCWQPDSPALWLSDFQWPGAKSASFPTCIPRWGENTGPTHQEIHINIVTTLSEFTVAMSTKQLGKLENEIGFDNLAHVSSSQNNQLRARPSFLTFIFFCLFIWKLRTHLPFGR